MDFSCNAVTEFFFYFLHPNLTENLRTVIKKGSSRALKRLSQSGVEMAKRFLLMLIIASI